MRRRSAIDSIASCAATLLRDRAPPPFISRVSESCRSQNSEKKKKKARPLVCGGAGGGHVYALSLSLSRSRQDGGRARALAGAWGCRAGSRAGPRAKICGAEALGWWSRRSWGDTSCTQKRFPKKASLRLKRTSRILRERERERRRRRLARPAFRRCLTVHAFSF